MTRPRYELTSIREGLRLLPDDERATAIVEMFSVACAEFGAVVLEHTDKPMRLPPLPEGVRNGLREYLQDMGVELRCQFLAALITALIDDFAALITERPKH